MLWEIVGVRAATRPAVAIPLASLEPRAFEAPAGQIAVSWFGHSTALLEIDGYRVLTDPVWSERCSPSDVIGPGRMHPPPVPLEALPALDAIVVSHDHYDHLDIDTILALARASGLRSSFRSASARTCVIGAFPTSASSNSTGTSTPKSTSSP